jgi:hypothetical protein
MTDRYMALTVVLERDLRDDDAAALITALKQLKGVIDVRPVQATGGEQGITRMRLNNELRASLFEWMGRNLS